VLLDLCPLFTITFYGLGHLCVSNSHQLAFKSIVPKRNINWRFQHTVHSELSRCGLSGLQLIHVLLLWMFAILQSTHQICSVRPFIGSSVWHKPNWKYYKHMDMFSDFNQIIFCNSSSVPLKLKISQDHIKLTFNSISQASEYKHLITQWIKFWSFFSIFWN
jgi:hypothetical protein